MRREEKKNNLLLDSEWNYMVRKNLVFAKRPICETDVSSLWIKPRKGTLFKFSDVEQICVMSNWWRLPTAEECKEFMLYFIEDMKDSKLSEQAEIDLIREWYSSCNIPKIWERFNKIFRLDSWEYRPTNISSRFDYETNVFWTSSWSSTERKTLFIIEHSTLSAYMVTEPDNHLWVWLVNSIPNRKFDLTGSYVFIK